MLRAAGVECRVLPRFAASRADDLPFAGRLAGPVSRRTIGAASFHARLLRGSDWADVVFVQETLLPQLVLARVRQRAGLIFDFSDPVHLPDDFTPSLIDRLTDGRWRSDRFDAIVSAATRVFIENEALSGRVEALGREPIVMRGPIDVDVFAPGAPKSRGPLVIGWTGSPKTYRYLVPVLGVLEEVARLGHPMELHLVGAPEVPRLRNVKVMRKKWGLDTEPTDVCEFDVAIHHLPDTPTTALRGGGKLLVYMAAGLPIVASRNGVGGQIIEHGRTGLLAATLEEWRDALTKLIVQDEFRTRLGERARQEAVTRHSYGAYLPLMLSALRSASRDKAAPQTS